MPTFKHPKTGVEINTVTIRRQSLSPAEQTTARELRAEGAGYHIIAAHFGINQGRIAELLGPEVERQETSRQSPQPKLDL